MLYLNLLISLLFMLAGITLIHKLLHFDIKASQPSKFVLITVVAAEFLLLYVLINSTFIDNGLNISFANVFTIVTFLISALYIFSALKQPVEIMGIIIFPLTGIAVLIQILSPNNAIIASASLSLQTHILLSLLSYSLLAIAAFQAVLLYFQNLYLRRKPTGGFVRSLPALESMENLLFQIIGLGFILLTLALFSGFIFIDDFFAQRLAHKSFFSIIAWGIFALLLWGRYAHGWRGKKAIRLSIGGFVLLMLAYFGSKFVTEFLIR